MKSQLVAILKLLIMVFLLDVFVIVEVEAGVDVISGLLHWLQVLLYQLTNSCSFLYITLVVE